MTDPHDRSARGSSTPRTSPTSSRRSVDELRAKHAECVELETEVSYVRRLTQARIDILEAEIERRASGGSLEDLIQPPAADPGRSRPAGEPGVEPSPPADGAGAGQRVGTRSRASSTACSPTCPPSPTPSSTRPIAGLRSLEREVSDQRRELFAVIDRIDLSLAAQLR